MKLYVSGPMSGMDDHNFPLFNSASDLLRKAGHIVHNPATKGVIKEWKWGDYLRHDLRELLFADGVATLPDWQSSRGATLEVYVATQVGMPVKTVFEWIMGVHHE